MSRYCSHPQHSDEYALYICRNSAEWNAQKQKAYNYWGKACRACWTTKGLTVHHLRYEKRGRHIFGRENIRKDLLVLCGDANKAVELALRTGRFKDRAHATRYVVRSTRRKNLLRRLFFLSPTCALGKRKNRKK